MKATILVCTLLWLGLGALGGAALNARYHFDPNWQENGCYTQERQHVTDELNNFWPAISGPVYLINSAIRTGLFDTGFSFRFGTPKRCDWAHNYNTMIKNDRAGRSGASANPASSITLN